ncbi:MAG: cupin domain-containing protein [candidate division Zixibacteria bacterium]|nr:cupin domain-containing protein [candidate division Zixibacteria bacterium]
MPLVDLKNVEEKEIKPGLYVRFVHSDNMTLAYWRFDPGVELPLHSHPHEQVVNVIEGELILTLDGVPLNLTPGKVVVIPPDVPHSGRAVDACRVIDAFYPVREDYR